MPAINVTEGAYSEAKEMAAKLGIGIGQYASTRLLAVPVETVTEVYPEELTAMALERSETPAETLKAALEALRAPKAIVAPVKANVAVWEDGLPPCRCDGEQAYGPWHRPTCHRRT